MPSDEEAKAIQELSKLGSKGLDSSEKAGKYLTSIFSEGIQSISHMFADSMKGMQIRNLIRAADKTKRTIERYKLGDNLELISDRNFIPLINALSIESNDELQAVWATYIANSLDPSQPNVTVNRQLIEMIGPYY